MSLLTLDDGNQKELIAVPSVSQDKLDELKATYKWSRFDAYDNLMWEYMYALNDPAIKKARVKRVETLWGKLTRPQKVFYAFLTFSGQTDNGGVWQFLFNYPELSLAALEAFVEIKAKQLAKDYRKTLEEAVGKSKSLGDLKRKANQKVPNRQKWAAFAEGYDQLDSTDQIEGYFFDRKFKKELYQLVCAYIEKNIDLFAKVVN